MFNEHSESDLPHKCLQVKIKRTFSKPDPEGSMSLLLTQEKTVHYYYNSNVLAFLSVLSPISMHYLTQISSSLTGSYALSLPVLGTGHLECGAQWSCLSTGIEEAEQPSWGAGRTPFSLHSSFRHHANLPGALWIEAAKKLKFKISELESPLREHSGTRASIWHQSVSPCPPQGPLT